MSFLLKIMGLKSQLRTFKKSVQKKKNVHKKSDDS